MHRVVSCSNAVLNEETRWHLGTLVILTDTHENMRVDMQHKSTNEGEAISKQARGTVAWRCECQLRQQREKVVCKSNFTGPDRQAAPIPVDRSGRFSIPNASSVLDSHSVVDRMLVGPEMDRATRVKRFVGFRRRSNFHWRLQSPAQAEHYTDKTGW